MANYIASAGGYLTNPLATSACEFCSMSSTNTYLESVSAIYSQRWRNWGIFLCFIVINMLLTVGFYWWARVPKGSREKKHK